MMEIEGEMLCENHLEEGLQREVEVGQSKLESQKEVIARPKPQVPDSDRQKVHQYPTSDTQEDVSQPHCLLKSKSFTKLSPHQLKVRHKLLVLLDMHLQNFQRVILMSRHRFHQRMRRRKALLRSFYIQQILELETQFLEMLPLPRMLSETPATDESPSKSTRNEEETPNNTQTFYEYALAYYTDEQWLAKFRMRRQTFKWLCDQLREVLQPNIVNAPLKNLILLEKRVAVSLYAFASGEDYRSIATLFAISRTSVCKFVHRFAEVLLEQLGTSLLTMPRGEKEYGEIRSALQMASNMPGVVVGVLGHCELSVSPMTEDASSFINDTGGYTIILQALIDDSLLFRKIQLQTKRLTLFLESPNEITELPSQMINGRQLPCCIVTSPALQYPLRTWLMRHYDEPMVPHEYDFNEAVDMLLLMQQQAFLRLFARWKILQRKSDLEPRTMERIAMACCALHNLLEENGEQFLEKWANDIDTTSLNIAPSSPGRKVAPDAEDALEMRDFLARTISSTEM